MHLDEVGFHPHDSATDKVMKTPPWKLIVLTICFELSKYKKSDTDPILYRLNYSFTDHTYIFTNGS